MAVSLKKPEKVGLEKTELPPKVRECTPVHLIDEEETIKRLRQPPNQPQQSGKFKQHCKDNDIKSSPPATNDSKTSIIARLLVLISTLLFGLVGFLVLYNYSPSGSSDPVTADFFDIISLAFSTIVNNPFCIAFLGLTFVGVFISLLKRILGGRR